MKNEDETLALLIEHSHCRPSCRRFSLSLTFTRTWSPNYSPASVHPSSCCRVITFFSCSSPIKQFICLRRMLPLPPPSFLFSFFNFLNSYLFAGEKMRVCVCVCEVSKATAISATCCLLLCKHTNRWIRGTTPKGLSFFLNQRVS